MTCSHERNKVTNIFAVGHISFLHLPITTTIQYIPPISFSLNCYCNFLLPSIELWNTVVFYYWSLNQIHKILQNFCLTWIDVWKWWKDVIRTQTFNVIFCVLAYMLWSINPCCEWWDRRGFSGSKTKQQTFYNTTY